MLARPSMGKAFQMASAVGPSFRIAMAEISPALIRIFRSMRLLFSYFGDDAVGPDPDQFFMIRNRVRNAAGFIHHIKV